MYKEVKDYLKKVDGISHLTIDPNGPGVVRIHLVPPLKLKLGISWVAIINGFAILPLTTGWAIILREFIEEAVSYSGETITDEVIDIIIDNTIKRVKKVFVKTDITMLKDDLCMIINTFVDIAKGIEPSVDIGYVKLRDYAKFMRAPHRMDLMISSMAIEGKWHCNQKCLHCYAGEQTLACTNELSTDEWKKIIDKCKDACIPQLTFTGGEPTLRSDLTELIEYSSWFVTRLNTNGVLLTKDLCDKLYLASLDSVQVTLYSHNEGVHNILVGSNNFKLTIDGIKNALSSKLNVSINTPLCKLNEDYVSLIKLGKELGITYFTCSGLIMTGNSENVEASSTYLSHDELMDVLTKAIIYAKDNNIEINFTSPGWLTESDCQALGLNAPACGACSSNMAIAPNGDIIACQSSLSSEAFGNMLKDDFVKVFTSKKVKEIRNEALQAKGCLLAKKEVI